MTTDNVRTFPGVANPQAAVDLQPQANVIAKLEQLLERAKAGQIRAIAFTFVKPGGWLCDGWEDDSGTVHLLMAGISYLQNRFATSVNMRDEVDASPPPQGA